MITLQAVRQEDRALFWNINQKYLYEMTQYYPDVMDEEGNYHYGYFAEYFIDPKRQAFFIYDDDTMVGFAMIHPYSVIGHTPDYTIAEFTIFPSYRRRGYATAAVRWILSKYHGNWEIKYNEKNTKAKRFWMTVLARYAPMAYSLNEQETVLEFSNKQ